MNEKIVPSNEPKVEVINLSGDASVTMPELLKERLPEVTLVIADTIKQIQNEVHIQETSNEEKKGLKLNSIEIKFGISLETEAGVIVSKVKGGATFEVSVSFNR